MRSKARTVGVISLGCSKNQVDTERMLGILKAAGGYEFVKSPGLAEVLIVNTCGFIEPAKQESIDAILEMAEYKKKGRCRALVVTGCLSERYRQELPPELPEADLFLGVREYEMLPGRLAAFFQEDGPDQAFCGAPRMLTTPPYTAYLRVGDGCDNRCAYCAIPLIRGPLCSATFESLVAEAERLSDIGVTELTLIAQDTSGYGRDLYGKPMLLPLMERIADIPKLQWVRVLYTYPDTVTTQLVEGICRNGKICNYLDIPLQHINAGILKSMNRRGTPEHIRAVLDWIRANAPDFMLRTTMMVGFPGETEEMFQELLAFLREYPFDRVGAFAFSAEEGTAAFDMPGQVPEEVKQARLHALMAQQAKISRERNEARVGTKTKVLITGRQGDTFIGRSYAEAPEVDGQIILTSTRARQIGDYVMARLIRAGDYDMMGEVLE